MAGLESIALAVAHLERVQQQEEQLQSQSQSQSQDGEIELSESFSGGVHLPPPPLSFGGRQLRMVSSDETVKGKGKCSLEVVPSSANDESPTPDVDNYPRGVIVSSPPATGIQRQEYPPLQQATNEGSSEWGKSSRSPTQEPQAAPSPSSQRKHKEVSPSAAAAAATAAADQQHGAGAVASVLTRISLVTDHLEDFFAYMEQLQQPALGGSATPAEVPKPEDILVLVQRNDVLLGRGGETNHHVGNIQYRQLVKACQPAYLAAKRRDKPRIAASIVQVVRSRSGRFLKKHSADSTWKDVGNTRAREKTSQALREGAPELRGTVPPPTEPSPPTARPTLVHHHHHGLPSALPVVSGPPFYQHHQVASAMGTAVYHHAPPVDSRYNHAYANNKRPMVTADPARQPKKRLVSRTTASKATAPPQDPGANVATSTRLHNFVSSSETAVAKVTVPASVSADHSEEERTGARVRTASPSSSTCSKNSSSGRGPRIKLLKKRLEDKAKL